MTIRKTAIITFQKKSVNPVFVVVFNNFRYSCFWSIYFSK
ncbi:MAG: hypothetical protein OJF59_003021 [Cytophagales bacterium]|nr:MAG: hypothetical protein OJF59_003021 [Cytophagales bacterium]